MRVDRVCVVPFDTLSGRQGQRASSRLGFQDLDRLLSSSRPIAESAVGGRVATCGGFLFPTRVAIVVFEFSNHVLKSVVL